MEKENKKGSWSDLIIIVLLLIFIIIIYMVLKRGLG
jgi:hypothetical protein